MRMGGRGSSSKKAQSIRSQLNQAYSDKNYYSKRAGLSNTARDLMLKSMDRARRLENELKKPQYNKTARDRFLNRSGLPLENHKIVGMSGGVKISASNLKKNDLRQISDYAQQNGLVYENAGGNVIVRKRHADEPF